MNPLISIHISFFYHLVLILFNYVHNIFFISVIVFRTTISPMQRREDLYDIAISVPDSAIILLSTVEISFGDLGRTAHVERRPHSTKYVTMLLY